MADEFILDQEIKSEALNQAIRFHDIEGTSSHSPDVVETAKIFEAYLKCAGYITPKDGG